MRNSCAIKIYSFYNINRTLNINRLHYNQYLHTEETPSIIKYNFPSICTFHTFLSYKIFCQYLSGMQDTTALLSIETIAIYPSDLNFCPAVSLRGIAVTSLASTSGNIYDRQADSSAV